MNTSTLPRQITRPEISTPSHRQAFDWMPFLRVGRESEDIAQWASAWTEGRNGALIVPTTAEARPAPRRTAAAAFQAAITQ